MRVTQQDILDLDGQKITLQQNYVVTCKHAGLQFFVVLSFW